MRVTYWFEVPTALLSTVFSVLQERSEPGDWLTAACARGGATSVEWTTRPSADAVATIYEFADDVHHHTHDETLNDRLRAACARIENRATRYSDMEREDPYMAGYCAGKAEASGKALELVRDAMAGTHVEMPPKGYDPTATWHGKLTPRGGE